MARLIRIAFFIACMLGTKTAFATTYYIDYNSGNDASNGTSNSTPWKHAPGMTNCTANCAATTPQAGDSFILKGGVTWPNASLGWAFNWSGTGSTSTIGCTGTGCIYIGVDKTWYDSAACSAGGSSGFCRPILNGGGSYVATTSAGVNVFLRLYSNYVKVDNLEFTGLYWRGRDPFGQSTYVALAAGSPGKGVNLELANLYLHGWSHDTYANGTIERDCGVVGDSGVPNNNVNSTLHDSIISGADTARDACTAVFAGPPIVYNNVMEYVGSGMILNGAVSVHDNLVQNVVPTFDPTAHLNGLEINATNDVTVYNNVFRHMGSGALTLWVGPNQGHTAYIFNNVFYDTDVNNVLDIGAPVINGSCTPNGPTYCMYGGTQLVWNNTVQCGPDTNPNAICAANINKTNVAVTLLNNHFITNQTSPNGGIWTTNGVTPTVTANVAQTPGTANGQGFTANQAYAFAPTAGTNATVGKGALASALCLASGVTACQYDTTYAVAVDSTHHIVTGPARTARLRPLSSPDVGAYQFTGGTTTSVSPPVGLAGVLL